MLIRLNPGGDGARTGIVAFTGFRAGRRRRIPLSQTFRVTPAPAPRGQWRQEKYVWHTSGWSHQSPAGKPVHEPFSEVLADHRKGQILSGSGSELR